MSRLDDALEEERARQLVRDLYSAGMQPNEHDLIRVADAKARMDGRQVPRRRGRRTRDEETD